MKALSLCKKALWLTVVAMFVLFVLIIRSPKDAKAIPAFARKYKTSCATCHVAFPKMTPFGEAFRRNGFQFPEGTDPQFIKEEPVSLGAEAQKRAFPDAIWPGAIPGTAPIAFTVENEVAYNKGADPKVSFGALPGAIDVLLGGTLGENVSFYGELGIDEGVLGVERVYLMLDNIVGPQMLFNLKIGQFEPGLFYFSNHRRYGPEMFITGEGSMTGDNNFSLEPTQQGLELNGVLGLGRLGYNLGVVEGRGNLINSAKDVYLHGIYKIGGMRLDGVVPENMSPLSNTQPWKDNSVILGGFAYFGKAKLGGDAGGTALSKMASSMQGPGEPEDKFNIFGGDAQIFYNRLNLSGAYSHAKHDSPLIADPNLAITSNNLMTELNVVAYPWLIPFARYEYLKIEDEKTQRLVPGVIALMRANVRFTLFGEINKFGQTDFSLDTFGAALDFAF
jgi:hypothetical protein